MDSDTIRKNFFDFMTTPPQSHEVIENVSLVPINDPSLLFVNSGMFPLVPYLLGQQHPLGTRLCNIQRCIRTIDIDLVGDYSHLTLFEMIGNWSLGDFGKKEQIPWMFELYVEKFGLDPKRCYVSVWAGDERIPRDDEAIELWKQVFAKYDIEAEFTDDLTKIPANIKEGNDWKYRIFPYGAEDNWWQRGPSVPGEIGGPTTELFYDLGEVLYEQDSYHINDDSGRFLEVGNSVFMEYKYSEDKVWEPMQQKNIDFGGGFERIVVASQDKHSVYETDLFNEYLERIEELSGKQYDPSNPNSDETQSFRIIAEHARAATFILADGIFPSNKDQGYILRRLIRRMVRRGIKLGIEGNFTRVLAQEVIKKMSYGYPHLKENEEKILNGIEKEELKFAQTLEKGLKELQKHTGMGIKIDGKVAFHIYETYGFPIEMIIEELATDEVNDSGDLSQEDIKRIMSEFEEEKKKHQQQSRAGAEKKFTGGLADHSEQTTMLHTAHHLLLAALQKVLGPHVKQRGSNITSERLRIDVSHNGQISKEELLAVEQLVNEVIAKDLPVIKKTMPLAKAEEIGAEMEFGQKYGDLVNVYFVGDPENPDQEVFSKEFCGGPHVENTGALKEMGKFTIMSEKSNGSGVRRIKATLVKSD